MTATAETVAHRPPGATASAPAAPSRLAAGAHVFIVPEVV